MEEIVDVIASEFGKMGAKFKVVSVAHLEELKEEIAKWRREGKLGEKLYSDYFSGPWFEVPAEMQGAKSIIVIAVPQGITILDFMLHGEHHRAVIPPTYVYSEIRNACTAVLSRIFERTGNKIARGLLPLKLLSVRSGLGKYGRNNISYIEGMGSFHRLEAFYTDYPFGTDSWGEKRAMDRCADCALCMRACPTKAIRADRFLVDAERCLTFFNESEGDLPEWIDSRSHNAIVGCMKCQVACPENREFVMKKEAVETFPEEETEAILRGTPMEKLPDELSAKIKRLNMDGYYSLLPRNLTALMRR